MHEFFYHPGQRISLAQFTANCAFKSASSISFDLELPAKLPADGGFVDAINVVGSLDLHYPCHDKYCPVRIRLLLPEQFEDAVSAIVSDLFVATAIPSDTRYEIVVSSPATSSTIKNYFDGVFGTALTILTPLDDVGVYASLLGRNTSAVVELNTSTIEEILSPIARIHGFERTEVQEQRDGRRHLDEWFRRSGTERPSENVVISFLRNCRTTTSMAMTGNLPFQTISSGQFRSKQQACASIPGCTQWWRFSAVGYDKHYSEALVHVDKVEMSPTFPVTRYYARLTRATPRWSLASTCPTAP